MNYKLILPVLALTAGVGAWYGIDQVGAMGRLGMGQETLIERLAGKLGKSTDEVREVFEEIRSEHQAQMQTEFEERLNSAVANGEISEEQKQLILQKHDELRSSRQVEFSEKLNQTRDEWKSQREAHRSELEKWASENGIDLKYFMGGMGKMGPNGEGKMMGRGFGGNQ